MLFLLLLQAGLATAHADGLAIARGRLDSITDKAYVLSEPDGSSVVVRRSSQGEAAAEKLSASIGKQVEIRAPFSAIHLAGKAKDRVKPHRKLGKSEMTGWVSE